MKIECQTMRIACLLVLVGVLAAAPPAQAKSHITPPRDYYLALGNSLAYGYHAALFAQEFPNINPASFNDGYVDDFSAAIRNIAPTIQTLNEGCPGETSGSLIDGNIFTGDIFTSFCSVFRSPSNPGFLYAWLHHPYGTSSQLLDALAFLMAHPKNTSPISIDIGANDLLGYVNACQAANNCSVAGVTAVYAAIAANLDLTLTQLQGVAPTAGYEVVGLYNAFPLVQFVPGITGDQAIAQLNSIEQGVATAHGAVFANPLPVFNPGGSSGGSELGDLSTICSYTAMCPGPVGAVVPGSPYNPFSPFADIHPTAAGYQQIANLMFAATGYN